MLRDLICAEFEAIELEGGAGSEKLRPGKFGQKKWYRSNTSDLQGGGGFRYHFRCLVFGWIADGCDYCSFDEIHACQVIKILLEISITFTSL